MITGRYYLHTNGSLIYKREFDDTMADLRESDFVRHIWPMDTSDREGAWRICIEALALGASALRVKELAEKWQCNDEDASVYAERVGCRLERDGNQWHAFRSDFVNIQESPSGFGSTCLEAMAELCKALGFKASKMWGSSFFHLLKVTL